MEPQHGRMDPDLKRRSKTVSGELHHSLAGVTMLLTVSVLSFSLGVCVGVAIMLLG